jgi:hypothetical protein
MFKSSTTVVAPVRSDRKRRGRSRRLSNQATRQSVKIGVRVPKPHTTIRSCVPWITVCCIFYGMLASLGKRASHTFFHLSKQERQQWADCS